MVLLGAARNGAAQQASAERPFVPWREETRLHWKDFQAPHCPPDLGAVAIRAGACTSTVVEVLPELNAAGKNTYWVASYLVKAKSWVRDSTVRDHELLLAHEQIHFDLNEVIARKMRARIRAYELAGQPLHSLPLQRELQGLFTERTELNTKFDLEAYRDASIFTLRQWQRWVAEQLEALAAYKAPPVAPVVTAR